MTIRKAQVGDLPELIKLGKRLLDQTPYRVHKIDTLTCGQTLGQCVSNAFGFAEVAVHDGKITGVMAGAALPLFYSKKRMATDLIIYSERAGDGVRMIRNFIDWAWSMPNVVEVTLSQSSGIEVERTGKIYRRLGFEPVGTIYTAVKEEVAAEEAA